MKKLTALMMIFLALAFVLTSWSHLMAADVIEIKAATVQPRKHPLHDKAYLLWGQEIEKRTKGKVKFKWYLAGSLIKTHQAEKAVEAGLVDVVVQVPVWLNESQYPVTSMLHLPLMVDSPLHASQIYHKAFQEIPEIQKEHFKVKVLGFWSTDSGEFLGKESLISKTDDFKGKKIWCPSKTAIDMITLLGGTPIQIKVEDVYMGLQRGMFETVFFPVAPAMSFKLVEQANKHTIGSYGVGLQYYAMNLKKWNSLPPDVQKVFEDLTVSVGNLNGMVLSKWAQYVLGELKKRGDEIHILTPEEREAWKKTLRPIYDKKIAALNEKGIDGEGIYNKLMEIVEHTRQNPYKPDAWWAGKLETK